MSWSKTLTFIGVLAFLSLRTVAAQTYTFTTIAGGDIGVGSTDGTNSAARFNYPMGLVATTNGNVFVADMDSNTIRQMTPDGTNWVVTTIAGVAGITGSADGTNSAAQFNTPTGITADNAGHLYVVDNRNNNIRQLTLVGTNWVVTTIAGVAGSAGTADGTNSAARFGRPTDIAIDYSGNLFVTDSASNTVRKLTPVGPDWVVSTIAGLAGSTGSADGTNSSARLNYPEGIVAATNGNIFVTDFYNHTIRQLTPEGPNWIVTTIAGQAGSIGADDGTNKLARFRNPSGITIDAAGILFVTDSLNDTIRRITPTGTNWVVTTIAGQTRITGSIDGTNSGALFYLPERITAESSGNLLVADQGNSVIRRLTPAGTNWVVTTSAGSAGHGTTDGIGRDARFNYPLFPTVDSAGNLYITDDHNHTIRKLAPAGTNWIVTTIAGQAPFTGNTDGTNAATRFNLPAGIVTDNADNLYVSDWGNNAIRKLTPVGTSWIVTTIAGGSNGLADGTNSAAKFRNPFGLAMDGAGNIFVADTNNNNIRKLTPAGTNWVVTTIVGNLGHRDYTDGTNSAAQFHSPIGIAINNAGILYVADQYNNVIRQITPVGTDWVVTTIAGVAGSSGNTDGANADARFGTPTGIAIDKDGNLFVTDVTFNTIRKLTRVGTNWVVTTVGGQAGIIGSADGVNTNALFNYPTGIAIDHLGNLIVVDSYNNTVRKGSVPDTAIILNGQSLPVALKGVAYSLLLQVTNGTAPYTWSVPKTTKLPAGLKLTADGWLSGKPTKPGTITNLTLTVHDSASPTNHTGQQTFSLTVVDPTPTFTPLAGTYTGLMLDTNAPTFANSGALTLVVSKTGAFAANLARHGTKTTFKGQFDLSGDSTLPAGTLSGSLHLDVTGVAKQITGTVTGSGFTSVVVADLTGRCPTNLVGSYTLVFSPTDALNTTQPQGSGYATLSISKTGVGTLAGALADGTKLAAKAAVSKDGHWPCYASLYKNAGAGISWVTLTTSNASGVVDWFAPATGSYAAFSTTLELRGSRFVASQSFDGDTTVALSGGGLVSNLVKTVTITDGKATVVAPGAEALTLKLTLKTGQFTGTFVPTGGSPAVPFTGLLLQAPAGGAGFFLNNGLSGGVRIDPAP